jgi:TrpR-related protein YerC/YecD
MGLPINEADWNDADSAALFDAIVALETRYEAAAFLRDLCTRRELEEMRSRWAVVRLLDDDRYSYREIHDMTGVSTATITRINQWLQHGTGGYRLLLDRTTKDANP